MTSKVAQVTATSCKKPGHQDVFILARSGREHLHQSHFMQESTGQVSIAAIQNPKGIHQVSFPFLNLLSNYLLYLVSIPLCMVAILNPIIVYYRQVGWANLHVPSKLVRLKGNDSPAV